VPRRIAFHRVAGSQGQDAFEVFDAEPPDELEELEELEPEVVPELELEPESLVDDFFSPCSAPPEPFEDPSDAEPLERESVR
jgi:hypothetical protein